MADFLDDYDEDLQDNYFPKKKRETIEVPDFLGNKEEIPLDEVEKAILNNTPGNTEIEEINHLNELEQVCQNYKPAEWIRLLYYCPTEFLSDEVLRRLKAGDEVSAAVKHLDGFLEDVKMYRRS